MKRVPGIGLFPDQDTLLLELIVVDKERRGSWYNVEQPEVWQACEMFELPYDEVMDTIQNISKDVHTLLINVPDFIAYLEQRDGKELTPREEFQNTFGPINDDQWQWLKEFTERNYDASDWFRGIKGYRHVPTDRIFHPSEMEIIR